MQITGAGCVSFEKSVEALSAIRTFLENRLQKVFLPINEDAFNSFPALNFSNRLLTPRRQLGYDTQCTIPEYIDPLKLRKIAGSEYVYATENHVLYSIQDTIAPLYVLPLTVNTAILILLLITRKPCGPKDIEIGDIVAIDFSILVVNGKDKKCLRMIPVLRGVHIIEKLPRDTVRSIEARTSTPSL